MSILGAVIVPHPPLIISTVGRGWEREALVVTHPTRSYTSTIPTTTILHEFF